jgi:hypothetical protein
VATVSPSFLCMDYYPYFEPRQQFAHFNRMPGATPRMPRALARAIQTPLGAFHQRFSV